MIVATTIDVCRNARASLGPLALVPTMGALHAGHISLVEHGRRRAARVAISIFVNPTQFGPHEDFHRYPRPLEDDLAKCREAGVDLVFCPSVQEMYPPGQPRPMLDIPSITSVLEGVHRPGHFAGVCQVVAKLFHIIEPQFACFGEKDFQQLAVLSAMTLGMNFPLTIVPCPTLRDPDGLAMSSRNRYLSPPQRHRALSISQGLFMIGDLFRRGERDPHILREHLLATLHDSGGATDVPTRLDYATIVDRMTLRELVEPIGDRSAQAVVAMHVGTTRLIDNIALTLDP